MKGIRLPSILVTAALTVVLQLSSCNDKIGPGDSCGNVSLMDTLTNLIGEVNTASSVFPNTELINFDDYSYTKNGKSYSLSLRRELAKDDICSFLENINVHSSSPKIIVPVLESKLVAVSISTSPLTIRSDGKSIENTMDIVWTWNSGLRNSTISNGRRVIEYSEGQMVVKGRVDSISVVAPLQSGRVYFLAMWAWDDQGKSVQSSSANIPFMAEKRVIDLTSVNFLVDPAPQGSPWYDARLTRTSIWDLDLIVDANTGVQMMEPLVPRVLTFRASGCPGDPMHRFDLMEGDSIRAIKLDHELIDVVKSSLFSNKLDILFACNKAIRFKTTINYKLLVLSYRRRH